MDENFRDRLAEELAGAPEPPVGDLVFDALRQGKRLRWVGRARIAGSALAAVVVLVIALLLGGHAIGDGRAPSASGTSSPRLTVASSTTATSWPDPAPVIEQPGGPKAPATLAAIAYRLQQLLPGAQLSHFANVRSDTMLSLQLYVDRGRGPGMVTVSILSDEHLQDCQASGESTTKCLTGPGGARTQVINEYGNCVESTIVSVDHGNGVVVEVDVATCLPWNGTTNPTCPVALTATEAIDIAADPSWGTEMAASLVTAADLKQPHLATS